MFKVIHRPKHPTPLTPEIDNEIKEGLIERFNFFFKNCKFEFSPTHLIINGEKTDIENIWTNLNDISDIFDLSREDLLCPEYRIRITIWLWRKYKNEFLNIIKELYHDDMNEYCITDFQSNDFFDGILLKTISTPTGTIKIPIPMDIILRLMGKL